HPAEAQFHKSREGAIEETTSKPTEAATAAADNAKSPNVAAPPESAAIAASSPPAARADSPPEPVQLPKQAAVPDPVTKAPLPDIKPAAPAKQGGRGAAVVLTAIVLGILGLSVWYLSRPTSLQIQGEADSTRIDMAA